MGRHKQQLSALAMGCSDSKPDPVSKKHLQASTPAAHQSPPSYSPHAAALDADIQNIERQHPQSTTTTSHQYQSNTTSHQNQSNTTSHQYQSNTHQTTHQSTHQQKKDLGVPMTGGESGVSIQVEAFSNDLPPARHVTPPPPPVQQVRVPPLLMQS